MERARVARDDLTRSDADADLDLHLVPRRLFLVEQTDQLDHLPRREHGSLTMAVARQGSSEDRH